jgi:hypothetical protein
MTDKPNFVLVPDDEPPAPVRTGGVLARLRAMASTAVAAAASAPAALRSALSDTEPPAETGTPVRPRLVFSVDTTASREPAWAAALAEALVHVNGGQRGLQVGLDLRDIQRATGTVAAPVVA